MSIKTFIVRASQTDLNNKNPAQCSSRLGRYHGMDQGSELEFADRKHENFIRPDCLPATAASRPIRVLAT